MPFTHDAIQASLSTYNGPVFRGVAPIFAANPFSGIGASMAGGRFNPKGVQALYTADRAETAIAEITQGDFLNLVPTTIYRIDIECERALDLTDPTILEALDITPAALSGAWRLITTQYFDINNLDVNTRIFLAYTQQLYFDFMKAGVSCLIVPSFAPTSPSGSKNYVFLNWNNLGTAQLTLHDPDNRYGAYTIDEAILPDPVIIDTFSVISAP